MKITLENGNMLKFWFSYGINEDKQTDYARVHCELNGEEHVATVTRFYRRGAPTKPENRRRALAKMLKRGLQTHPLTDNPSYGRQRCFTREERRLIWTEYFKQHADLRRRQKASNA